MRLDIWYLRDFNWIYFWGKKVITRKEEFFLNLRRSYELKHYTVFESTDSLNSPQSHFSSPQRELKDNFIKAIMALGRFNLRKT